MSAKAVRGLVKIPPYQLMKKVRSYLPAKAVVKEVFINDDNSISVTYECVKLGSCRTKIKRKGPVC